MVRTLSPQKGEYKIKKKLGEGASSIVFLASKQDAAGFWEQEVALKILKSKDLVQDLRNELGALMKVRSANCVSVFGWEILPEGPVIVMEAIKGVSLSILSSYGLNTEEVDEICSQAARGLRDLEAANTFHGDLSLANILVDEFGQVKLVDFGLSAASKTIRGTAQFLSARRWRGEPASLQDDFFSLNLIREDLLGGNLNPAPSWFWKERATKRELIGWPEGNLEGREDVAAKRSLGNRVKKILQEEIASQGTAVQILNEQSETPARGNPYFRGLRHFLMGLALSLIVNQPTHGVLESQHTGNLVIRTRRWIEVSVDGINFYYSPQEFHKLRIGTNKVFWRRGAKSGEKIIQIGAKEELLLTDKDFPR